MGLTRGRGKSQSHLLRAARSSEVWASNSICECFYFARDAEVSGENWGLPRRAFSFETPSSAEFVLSCGKIRKSYSSKQLKKVMDGLKF